MKQFYLLCTCLLLNLNLQAQFSLLEFEQTVNTYTEITGGTQVAVATSTTAAGMLDDIIYTLPDGTIPFNFTFNGTAYTGFKISTNGFITFGATAPSATGGSTGYAPISATTAYSGAISALGRNLAGYYLPTAVPARIAEIRYEVIGVAPNRIMVIQWKNFRNQQFGNNGTQPVYNFQIRLHETSNEISLVYNGFSNSPTNAYASPYPQVGLRGATNGVFLNRSLGPGTASGSWSASLTGTINNLTCYLKNDTLPANGLTYRWFTPLCPKPTSLGYINSTETQTTLRWRSPGGGGSFEVEYGPNGFAQGTGTIVLTNDTFLLVNGLTANTTYQFYVRQNCNGLGNGLSGWSGPALMRTGGPGEDCSTAFAITVFADSLSAVASTVTSGVSQNGPNAQCGDATSAIADDDVWFSFTAPVTNNSLQFITQAGTVNDWAMEIWKGCPGAPGSLLVRCVDDYEPAPGQPSQAMPRTKLCQNEFIGGQLYFVRLWTYSQSLSGTASLRIYQDVSCPLPPSNDECVNADSIPIYPPLSCPGSELVFTTLNATNSTGFPVMNCDNGQVKDVWLRFNTGSVGTFNLTITPITATILKAAIIFECGAGGFEVQCFNPANGTYTVSGLNPSANYLLRVWSDTLSAGTFSVCLNDVCDEPTALLSGSFTICNGGTAPLRVDLTGTPPWSFTYTDGTTPVTLNTSTTPYFINVSPTVSTSYSMVSMSSVYCSGIASGNASVTLVSPPTVTLSPFSPVCSNVILPLTGGMPIGGFYSGPGVTGSQFNAALAGPGTHLITYSYGVGSGCQQSASQSIQVLQAPALTSFTPGTGPVGTVVSLTGSGLDSLSSVSFNGTAAAIFSSLGTGSASATVPAGASSGFISVSRSNGCTAQSGTIYIVGTPPSTVNLNLKVYLQGFYNTVTNNMVAVSQPILLPNQCDTIDVFLRQGTAPYSIIASRRGPINISGNGTFIFNSNAVGSYYIVVKHRSSVQTWSANPVSLALGLNSFDFTVSPPSLSQRILNQVMSPSFSFDSSDRDGDGFQDELKIVPSGPSLVPEF